MKNDNNKTYDKYEESEDVTKYGEFIASYFAWLPINRQKEKAEEMHKITKSNNKINKK